MSGGDFQDTLNELERRLRDLMADLGGSRPAEGAEAQAQPAEPATPPPMPPYRSPPEPQPPEPAPAPGGLQDQLAELLRFRDQLTEAAKKLVEDYSRVLEQITRVVAAPAPAPPPPAPPPPTPASGHVTFPVPPPTSQSTESTLYSGQITIEAEPFADIAGLAAFEAAVRNVPSAEDVEVSKFKNHRAVVGLTLAADTPLVFELRRASDQTFDVEDAEPGRLVLTMHTGELPFPMRP